MRYSNSLLSRNGRKICIHTGVFFEYGGLLFCGLYIYSMITVHENLNPKLDKSDSMADINWSGRAVSAAVGCGVGAGAVACIWYLYRGNKPQRTAIPDSLLGSIYKEELKIASQCAFSAGSAIRDAMDAEKVVSGKAASAVDFVTSVDVANERLIFDSLKKSFPDHFLIGEVVPGSYSVRIVPIHLEVHV